MISVLAPAKINLGLHVLRRREDGFHDLETVFVRIPWCDRITAAAAPDCTMTCSDPELPTDERNLCLRAATRLAETLGIRDGVRLHLEKNVPYGAGLGSGSSDAAATLRLVCRVWNVSPPEALLAEVAAELGSDVPFFLGGPVALGTGRGEILAPLDGMPPLSLVVAVPAVHVATGVAYGLVRPHAEGRPDLSTLVTAAGPVFWRGRLVNDFEHPVGTSFPEIARLLARMEESGATYAALSGSGSAVFGIFEDGEAARKAAEGFADVRVWYGTTGDPA